MKILRSWLEDFIDLGTLREIDALKALLARGGIEMVSWENPDDPVFEIEIYANRPDLLSHYGLAREIGVLAGLPLKKPKFTEGARGEVFPISIESDRCDRYCGLVMRGVIVKPSPDWMQERLRAMGLNPISNIVDATNYVLFEFNHPLHAFDLDRLKERVVVREAKHGEKISLLDGSEKKLTPDDLVVADASRPVALAGVMGGIATAVGPETKDLLLEAAWFLPSSVRRSAKRHGSPTDSSYRFERGADREILPLALSRLSALILKTAGGKIDGGLIDVRRRDAERKNITFRRTSVRRMLGHDVENSEEILTALGATVSGENVTPPSWRFDLSREIDLVEEVARISGYDALGSTLPGLPSPTKDFNWLVSDAARFREMRAKIAGFFTGQGFDQCVTFSFCPPDQGSIKISNPINAEESSLRASLLPSLLRVAQARRDKAGATSICIFEIDKVFFDGPREGYSAAAVLMGNIEERRYDGRPADPASIHHALGLLHGLARLLRVDPKRCGTVVAVEGGFGIELDLLEIFKVWPAHPPQYASLPRFPASTKDLAFWVSGDLAVGNVISAAKSVSLDILEDVELFDLFAKKGDPRKSVGIRIHFRAKDRTLTDEEITAALGRIVDAVAAGCGASLRSK